MTNFSSPEVSLWRSEKSITAATKVLGFFANVIHKERKEATL